MKHRNENGFTFLTFVGLMPAIFLSALILLSSYHLISKYAEAQSTCRSHVMEAQKSLGEKLTKLMDLNPKARSLRLEDARLKSAIALALVTSPPAAIPLKKLLDINLFRQGVLRGEQEMIIMNATREAREIMSQLRSNLKNSYHSSVSLKIFKNPIFAIAPDHLPVPFFTELQAIKVNWKINMSDLFSRDFLFHFQKTGYLKEIKGTCAATLIKRGDVWNPKLHQAKFL